MNCSPLRKLIITPELIASIHAKVLGELNDAVSFKIRLGRLIFACEKAENDIKENKILDVFEIAFRYAGEILKQSPFSKGNKRTALAFILLYLKLNEIYIENDPIIADILRDLANGNLSEKKCAVLFFHISSVYDN